MLVYAVIKGERKCLRGESHRIAVALGLKSPGAIRPEGIGVLGGEPDVSDPQNQKE